MDARHLTFDLNYAEYRDYVRHDLMRSRRARRGIWVERMVVLVLALVGPIARGVVIGTTEAIALSVLTGAAVALPLAVGLPWVWRLARVEIVSSGRAADRRLLGCWDFEFTAEGLAYHNGYGSGVTRWSSLEHVDAVATGVYIYLPDRTAYVLPSAAFAGKNAMEDFARAVTERMTAHAGSPMTGPGA